MRIKTNRLSFRLRSVTDEEKGGGTPKPSAPEPGVDGGGDFGFPAETPIAEMTPEQQAAYWRHQARKHEKRAKPGNFDEIVAAAQRWEQHERENQTPDEQARNAALDEGRREGAQTLLHDAVRAELKAARPHMTTEELNEFLEDVALDKFLGTDGRLDTDRVQRLAGKLAAAPEQGGGTPPEPDPSQGGTLLGNVLGNTTPPPSGNAGSVDDFRAREAQRYAATNTNK